MTAPPRAVALMHGGILTLEGGGGIPADTVIRPVDPDKPPHSVTPLSLPGLARVDPVPQGPVWIELPGAQPLHVRPGGWSGLVERTGGGRITGWARDNEAPDADVVVVAVGPNGTIARGTARSADSGRFTLTLPADIARAPYATQVVVGIAGSDHILRGGRLRIGGPPNRPAVHWRARAEDGSGPALRLKISTPNLKEAPLWGDYHFANSLSAAFARLGRNVGVDPMDAWYARTVRQDAVLAIRGRQPLRLDPGQVNVMWLISHPDRVPDEEYAGYDHVAVASDIYAERLRERGLTEVSVLHQATDADRFGLDTSPGDRRAASLFVGNSRREYRTMVKWCIERDVPLDLYGGGWDGILPPGFVRAASVGNADLPALYARHLLLLNDHWDSMRDNGFLSNRLFDGSATGTPILTDPVAGLDAVFGDTIAVAADADAFAAQTRDCFDDPAPWLARAARARDIVLGAHTFDHRAVTLAALVDRIAARKLG